MTTVLKWLSGGYFLSLSSQQWVSYQHEIGKTNKTCLNETYSRVRVDKHLSDMFPIKNDLKQGDAFSTPLFKLVLEFAFRRVQINRMAWN